MEQTEGEAGSAGENEKEQVSGEGQTGNWQVRRKSVSLEVFFTEFNIENPFI